MVAKVDKHGNPRKPWRPFDTVEEMNDTILDNINSIVTNRDMLYILGDLSFGSIDDTLGWLARLKCKQIFLIKGNHDRDIKKIEHKFIWVRERSSLTIEGQYIVLDHYAARTWNMQHHGAWQLHGHSHGNLEYTPLHGRTMDVGMDTNNYKPYAFSEVKEIMSHKQYIAEDHHCL
jgi:calcineurin-like phosphoesterase family protein